MGSSAMMSFGESESARATPMRRALTAAQLVGITFGDSEWQAHHLEQSFRLELEVPVPEPVDHERLGEERADLEPGAERADRILEHHGDVATEFLELAPRQARLKWRRSAKPSGRSAGTIVFR